MDGVNLESVWWKHTPWWVEQAKELGAHHCICPVCDRDHQPGQGRYYGALIHERQLISPDTERGDEFHASEVKGDDYE